MEKKALLIDTIPSLLRGNNSDKVYIYVHGKMANKDGDLAKLIANVVNQKGYQLLSFDLPEHGHRKDQKRCDVFDGVQDLETILNYACANYKEINVIACSIGAYFSLQILNSYPISRCLFLSPIINMEYLISLMFKWFNVDENRLEKEKEIQTPVDPLRYDYYCYVKSHPLTKWDIPTFVLFGAKDNLQSLDIMNEFKEKYHANLTISSTSEHAFLSEEDMNMIKKWLIKNT